MKGSPVAQSALFPSMQKLLWTMTAGRFICMPSGVMPETVTLFLKQTTRASTMHMLDCTMPMMMTGHLMLPLRNVIALIQRESRMTIAISHFTLN